MSKYRAIKTTVNGKTFDSKKEAGRYLELRLLEKAGKIKNLQCQVKFELQPPYKKNQRKVRSISYVADFVYEQDGKTIVEDVKGQKTQVYNIKKKLFEYHYPYEIKEV